MIRIDIDTFLLNMAKKMKIINVNGSTNAAFALVHVLTSALWASVFAHLSQLSLWFLLSAPVWILYTLYKELYLDEHLKNILNGTETKEDRFDFVSDLFTKFIGLVFYLLYFVRG